MTVDCIIEDPRWGDISDIAEIAADLASPLRMNRLLQGDVGSGKTLVALMALLCVVEAGGQGVMMAPTEILARQHLDGLRPLAEYAGIRLEILTGRDKGAARKAKLADLADGRINILVGTHAVFQKDVAFHDLRLAVIDEQHRFGVSQRMELGAKGRAVDVLVMTATPIPRSLALAQYGDMDVSVLDEKPPGRTPVTTALVATSKIDQVVDRLRAAVAEGRRAAGADDGRVSLFREVDEQRPRDAIRSLAQFEHAVADVGHHHQHGQHRPAGLSGAKIQGGHRN